MTHHLCGRQRNSCCRTGWLDIQRQILRGHSPKSMIAARPDPQLHHSEVSSVQDSLSPFVALPTKHAKQGGMSVARKPVPHAYDSDLRALDQGRYGSQQFLR